MFNNSIHKVSICIALTLTFSANAMAVTEIPFWHSMEGELGKEVDSIADRFNQSQPDYKIVPVYKGNYEQSLAAGIAAFRSGKAPAILQVYEVGTATMMASKAIKPVYQVFKDANIDFDESVFVPTVAGYYTDSKTGRYCLSRLTARPPCCITTKRLSKKRAWTQNNRQKHGKNWQQIPLSYALRVLVAVMPAVGKGGFKLRTSVLGMVSR